MDDVYKMCPEFEGQDYILRNNGRKNETGY